MKKLVYLTFAALLFCCLAGQIRAEKLEIGQVFPIDKLSKDQKPTDNTIVVFIPSLTFDCEYASMLTQSFYYYFDRQMAFEGLKKSPSTRIFLVVGDEQNEKKSTKNIIGGMNVVYDPKGELFSFYSVDKPTDKNGSSTVVLLDSTNKIALMDFNYRAQGEHLKPLENKLKELNSIAQQVKVSSVKKDLKIGDEAPDFIIDETTKLSDLRGEVILISFYPAAFSGVLPNPGVSEILKIDDLNFTNRAELMSCSLQIKTLDLKPAEKKTPKRILISSSTDSLLSQWREVLGTKNIEYANDPDYSISNSYFSYNPNGYNNRVSVIVDQKGKIAYIDTDFELKDEAVLNAKMDELLNSKIGK